MYDQEKRKYQLDKMITKIESSEYVEGIVQIVLALLVLVMSILILI